MGAGGEEEEVVHQQAGAVDGVAIEEMEFIVVEKEVAQVEVGVTELGAAEFFQEINELLGEVVMIGQRLGVELEAIQMLVELDGGLDAFEDDGVAFAVADFEAHEGGDGARGRNLGALEQPKALEFAHGGASAETAADPVAKTRRWIKFQVIRFAGEFKAPDLAVGAVLDELAMGGQVKKSLLEVGGGHGLMIRAVQRIVEGEGGRVEWRCKSDGWHPAKNAVIL
jgi:hypothetical protein